MDNNKYNHRVKIIRDGKVSFDSNENSNKDIKTDNDEHKIHARIVRGNEKSIDNNNDNNKIVDENIEIDILQNLVPLIELESKGFLPKKDLDRFITTTNTKVLEKLNIDGFDLIQKYNNLKKKADESISNLSYNELQYLLKVDLNKGKRVDEKENKVLDILYERPFENYIRTMGKYENYIRETEGIYESDKNLKINSIEIETTLGEYLKENGISQVWLAEHTGINRVTLANIIAKPFTVTLANANRISFILKVSIDKLFPCIINTDNEK